MSIRIIKGESVWVDCPGDSSLINAAWPGTWVGTWKICATDSIDAAALVSGDMTLFDGVHASPLETGKFRAVITPAHTTTLGEGIFYLFITVTNSAVNFQSIESTKFVVKL